MTRYVSFEVSGEARLGVVSGTDVIDVGAASGGELPTNLLGFLRAGRDAQTVVERLRPSSSHTTALADIRLLPPIVPTKNVFAVGRNYVAHVEEGAATRGAAADLPEVPVFFTKPPTAVIGPDDIIPSDTSVTTKLDWEAELAVIIGRSGRNIRAADALSHVFGYTAANDVSARDLQFAHGQWFKGKALDGSCPLGPFVVTKDEVPEPQRLEISCRVNDVVKQKANTSQMIFAIPTIIEWLSAGITLEPGDVILTGTPEGVGFARQPPEYLQVGDVVEVDISGVGTLRNYVGERRET